MRDITETIPPLVRIGIDGSEALDPADASPGWRFDYSQMEDGAAIQAKAVVDRYRERQRAYVIDTGRDLLAVKERLDHGLFLKWVEAEMGITARTAQNLMQAATQLGHKSEIVSHLPPTTLYKLASPSTPAPIREEIVSLLEAGEGITAKQIDARLHEARREAKREAVDAKLAPEERKRQQKLKREREARHKREREKTLLEMIERSQRRAAATKELADLLVPLLNDETFRQVQDLLRDCDTHSLHRELAASFGLTEKDQAFHDRVFTRSVEANNPDA